MIREEDIQREWYRRYYAAVGAERNDLRTNPGARFQTLASELSLMCAVSRMDIDPGATRLLDVGCGGGGGLFQFLRMGFRAGNVTGIDIQAERIALAREIYPHMCFIHGDASRMDASDGAFDLVYESTLFSTLTDADLRCQIAREMVRVCRSGGFLLLVDWRISKPFSRQYKALSRAEIVRLFDVGGQTDLVAVARGALVPPVGRFLSGHAPSLYFLVAALCPVLVGQVAYVLRKP